MKTTEWIEELLNGIFNASKCRNCGKLLKVNSKVLINSRTGFFVINPRDNSEKLKKILKKYELISKDGKPIKQILSLSGPKRKKNPNIPPFFMPKGFHKNNLHPSNLGTPPPPSPSLFFERGIIERDDVGEFRGAELLKREVHILRKLEIELNKKIFREPLHVNNLTSFGFREFDYRVYQIAIQRSVLKTLPNILRKLDYLRWLLLIDNKLKELPEFIGDFKYLEVFHAPSNNISNVPQSICRLKKLKTLNLNINRIHILPPCICELESLEELDLLGNGLTSLPNCIGDLTELRELELRDNNLTSLPHSLLDLQNLKVLSLKNNPVFDTPSAEDQKILKILQKRGIQLESLSSQTLDAIEELRHL